MIYSAKIHKNRDLFDQHTLLSQEHVPEASLSAWSQQRAGAPEARLQSSTTLPLLQSRISSVSHAPPYFPSVWKASFPEEEQAVSDRWSICFPPVESAAASEGIARRGSYKRAHPNARCLTTTSEEHEHTASLWLKRLVVHTTHPPDILYLSGSIHSTPHTKYG